MDLTPYNTNTPEFKSWLVGCQEIVNDSLQRTCPTLWATQPDYGHLTVQQGRRYIKIVQKGSVWAFVDRTNGDVLKPATWTAPAKHARGNILDASNGLALIGPHGPAYLR